MPILASTLVPIVQLSELTIRRRDYGEDAGKLIATIKATSGKDEIRVVLDHHQTHQILIAAREALLQATQINIEQLRATLEASLQDYPSPPLPVSGAAVS